MEIQFSSNTITASELRELFENQLKDQSDLVQFRNQEPEYVFKGGGNEVLIALIETAGPIIVTLIQILAVHLISKSKKKVKIQLDDENFNIELEGGFSPKEVEAIVQKVKDKQCNKIIIVG